MSLTVINGVQVHFPYTPYQVQHDYMAKVLECLQTASNGILESPTGTGKTLSLLCSSLAWLENKKAQHQLMLIKHSSNEELETTLNGLRSQIDKLTGAAVLSSNFLLPKIIYSSRTHSQLSQAIQELKRTSYKHIRSVVLGSRDQLCLHSEVAKIQNNANKIYACRTKVVNRACPFHLGYEEKLLHKEYQDRSVMDIEDLITLGKKYTCCPYYASRNLKAKADMVFAPYNYVIDPKIRRSQGIELEGNVVIFDEGHNIEGVCEESMSFQLRSVDLALCINEVSQTMTMIQDLENADISSSEGTIPDFTMTDLSVLKVMFCELEEQLDKEVAEAPNDGSSKPGDYMIDILSRVELTPNKRDVIVEVLDKIILFHSASATSPWSSKGAGLLKFSEIVKILFARNLEGRQVADLKKEFSLKYRIYLQYETNAKTNKQSAGWGNSQPRVSTRKSWKLDCWCFSPGIGMQDVMNQGVYSILLTSGTLSPLPPLISELGISFPIHLENPHIVSDKQVFIGVITQGPDGTLLNSSYQNRFNEKYINSLGRTITNFCRIIPDGVLTFFPSYTVMRSNIARWEETGVWQSLSGIKPALTEPQGKDAFNASIESYYNYINNPEGKGATLLAVCRGKVSEGLDFADKNARAVIVTGLPFPPSMDPRVKMKMAYLDNAAKQSNGLVGCAWYILQASRAVNQAIGRVIRHKDDYGAILLCDNRFSEKRIQSQLSRWVQGRIRIFDSFGPALKELSLFFKEVEGDFSKKLSSSNSLGGFQVNSANSFAAASSKTPARCKENAEKMEQTIFNDYMNSRGNSSNSESKILFPSEKPSSIFDAIKMYDDITTEPITHAQSTRVLDSNEMIASTSTAPKPAKKMKLSVKLREVDKPEEASTVTSSTKKVNPNCDREMWQNFLFEVKSLLQTKEKYSSFCSAVKDFRANKEAEPFAIRLGQIFHEISQKRLYLERIASLVNTKDREKFLFLCTEQKSYM